MHIFTVFFVPMINKALFYGQIDSIPMRTLKANTTIAVVNAQNQEVNPSGMYPISSEMANVGPGTWNSLDPYEIINLQVTTSSITYPKYMMTYGCSFSKLLTTNSSYSWITTTKTELLSNSLRPSYWTDVNFTGVYKFSKGPDNNNLYIAKIGTEPFVLIWNGQTIEI